MRIALVVALALAVRLGALWLVADTPLAGDEREYFVRAQLMHSGGLDLTRAARPPGMDAVYASAFAVFSPSILVARLTNVAASVMALLPLYAIARRFAGERAALGSILVAALYPNFIAFSHYLWAETMYMLLSLSGVALLVSHRDAPSSWKLAGAGILLALTALTREVAAAFPPLAAIWLVGLAWKAREGAWRAGGQAGLLLASFAIVLLPWNLAINRGDAPFALLTRTSWMNVYIGNGEPVTGEDGRTIRPRAHYFSLGQNRAQMEQAARGLALEAIRERMPAWPFEKLASELPRFFTPTSFAIRRLLVSARGSGAIASENANWAYRIRGEPIGPSRARAAAVTAIAAAYTGVVVLGVGGLVLARRRDLAALFALFALAHLLPAVLTFAASRFRLPVMPLLIVSAVALADAWRRGELDPSPARRTAALAAMAAMLGLVVARMSDAWSPIWR